LRAYLEKLKQNALVKGVRRLIQDEPLGFCVQENFIAGVHALAEYDFTFDICIRHWQLPDAIQLVRASPQINFVLDHCGKPDIKNHILEPWRAQIYELAKLPNVWCKLSGLVTEADPAKWMADDPSPELGTSLQPYIAHVMDAFGADRVMFGSDAPVAYLASAYERWVETLQNATNDLTQEAQEKLWRANAVAFYRLRETAA
jgi:L-fuconolactonase